MTPDDDKDMKMALISDEEFAAVKDRTEMLLDQLTETLRNLTARVSAVTGETPKRSLRGGG